MLYNLVDAEGAVLKGPMELTPWTPPLQAGQAWVVTDPTPPSQSEVIAQYERALDNHLDSVAKQYRYNDRFTFALRAGYPGPYHDEAVAFAAWMDTCNVQAFTLLSEVQAGNATMPTIEGFIESLPVFVL